MTMVPQYSSLPVDSEALCPGYRLRQFIGRGGFGEVWAAETGEGSPIALKFLPCGNDSSSLQELKSIQVVRQLRHPNLITIDKVWASMGYLVVAMELADSSLLDFLQVYQAELGASISFEDLHPFLTQAADAIDFLNARQHPIEGHLAGIQHCDVNPRNLLLFGDKVKLSDFSLTTLLT